MVSVLATPKQSTRVVARIYVPAAILATVIALAGFWPSYFGPLLAGTVDTIPLIHFHAAVYTGWLVLVIAQGVLAATGQTALHMKIGKLGMSYGVFLIFVGFATAFTRFAQRIDADKVQDAQRILFGPLTDMLVFSAFLGAAWLYRRQPEIHKRLIIVATTVLLIAAVGRMPFWKSAPAMSLSWPHIGTFLLVWLSPIYVAMIYDYVRRRLIHPVYVIGILTLGVLRLRNPLRQSEAWLDFSAWLAAFYI